MTETQNGTSPQPTTEGSPLTVTRPDFTEELDKIRISIARSLFFSFPVLLLCTLGALIFLFAVISGNVPTGDAKALTTAEKMALAASIQVAFGMVMGFVSVFIGLMMTWFGLNAAFAFTGKAGERGEVALQSASPGLLFFLGGIILIGVSLYKPITYEDRGDTTRVPTNTKTQEAIDGVIPNPLPADNTKGS
jgi:hypothetical protein